MNDRTLGATGLVVSEIGFGAWGIGGTTRRAAAYGPTDDQESLRALAGAVELGVTFYDTAALYGEGHSEVLLGAALRAVRSRVVIASKVGYLDSAGTQEFSPAHLRASLEQSLRRLQSDYLDLYQLHDPPRALLERGEALRAVLDAFQREGKIRAAGVTVRDPADAVTAVRHFGTRCLQVNFNLLDQRARDQGLWELCRAAQVGVIVRTPLCFGFLTGAYAEDRAFDAQDHRSRWSPRQRALWAKAHEVFSPIRQHQVQTPAQFALRFCLAYPEISTVIPGILTAGQIEENAAASQLGPLPEADRQAVEQEYQQHQFFLHESPVVAR